MTTDTMFNEIDKLTYEISSNDYKKIYVSNRFYEVIDELYTTNTEWFYFENIKLIKEHFDKIIDCIAILYFDKEKLNIYNVEIIGKNIVKKKKKYKK